MDPGLRRDDDEGINQRYLRYLWKLQVHRLEGYLLDEKECSNRFYKLGGVQAESHHQYGLSKV